MAVRGGGGKVGIIMNWPPVKNVLKDEARKSEYHIYAFRELNPNEKLYCVAQYLRTARKKNPPQGRVIRIATQIGLIPGALPPTIGLH